MIGKMYTGYGGSPAGDESIPNRNMTTGMGSENAEPLPTNQYDLGESGVRNQYVTMRQPTDQPPQQQPTYENITQTPKVVQQAKTTGPTAPKMLQPTEAQKVASKTETSAKQRSGTATTGTGTETQAEVDAKDGAENKITGVVSAIDPLVQSLDLYRKANVAEYEGLYRTFNEREKYAPDKSQSSQKYAFLTADLTRPPKEQDFTEGMPSMADATKLDPLTYGASGTVAGVSSGAKIGSAFGMPVPGAIIGGAVGLIGGVTQGLISQGRAKKLDRQAHEEQIRRFTQELENYRLKKDAMRSRVAQQDRMDKEKEFLANRTAQNEAGMLQALDTRLRGKELISSAVEGARDTKLKSAKDKVAYKVGGMYGRY